MLHYEKDSKIISEVLEELNSNRFEGMAQVIEILLNEEFF